MNDECKYSNKKWMDADASVNFRHKKRYTNIQIARKMQHNCIWVGWLQPPNENYLTTGIVFPRKWWKQNTVKTTYLSENHIIFLNLFGHEFWGSTRSGGLQIPGPPSCSKFMACNSQASPTSPVFAHKNARVWFQQGFNQEISHPKK